eukprot:2003350-Lingulodinium_polyedra.AAC.1
MSGPCASPTRRAATLSRAGSPRSTASMSRRASSATWARIATRSAARRSRAATWTAGSTASALRRARPSSSSR